MAIRYTRPSDNVAANATVSLTVGSADSNYPLANLTDLIPGKPFKALEAAATIRFTFGSPVTIVGLAIINHNLVGKTVTIANNNGMAAQTVTIPANTEDGQSMNPFEDLSEVTTAATVWDLAISGGSALVAIGEIILFTSLRTVQLVWGLEDSDRFPAIVHTTDYGVQLVYNLNVRIRKFRGQLKNRSQTADFVSLLRSAHDNIFGWLFIPDDSVNDALWVRFMPNTNARNWTDKNVTDIVFEVEEVSRGLIL